MSIIPIRFELARATPYEVWLNGQKVVEHSQNVLEFDSMILKDHMTHELEIKGHVEVIRLWLDGIDTEYFVHHGFTPDRGRGNAHNQSVKYYFNTPVWRWYMEWHKHDNSTFRELSKDHSGFLPL